MKKIISIIMVLALVFGVCTLSSCGKDKKGKSKAEKKPSATYDVKFYTDTNSDLYWDFESDNEKVIKITSYFEPFSENGTEGLMVFTAHTKKAGTANVKFKRIKDSESEPDSYAVYTFVVNKDLKYDNVISGESHYSYDLSLENGGDIPR